METGIASPKFCFQCGADWRAGVTTLNCAACNRMMEANRPPDLLPPHPVPPHQYPLWLMAFCALVVALALYSATLLPPFWAAAREMHRGDAALRKGDRRTAEALYTLSLEKVPTSATARLDMAVLLFGNPSDADHRRALTFLTGMKLEKGDWARVSAVLPPEYRSLFHTEK